MSNLKTLHRIYFGFDGKKDLYIDYLNTWVEKLPGYEIKHWNATNLPMDLNDYVKALYEIKDGVFLSDFFRWWILSVYGGVYLDADIEIVNGEKFNSIIEELEKTSDYDFVMGIEADDGYTAHSMAGKPNSKIATFMCAIYENIGKLYYWRKRIFTAPILIRLFFIDNKLFLQKDGFIGRIEEPTIVERIKIYPKNYFSPKSFKNINLISDYSEENTCICHHFGSSWIEEGDKHFKNKTVMERRRKMFKDYFRNGKPVERSFFEYLFSVYSSSKYSVIYLFGIKIVIKREHKERKK